MCQDDVFERMLYHHSHSQHSSDARTICRGIDRTRRGEYSQNDDEFLDYISLDRSDHQSVPNLRVSIVVIFFRFSHADLVTMERHGHDARWKLGGDVRNDGESDVGRLQSGVGLVQHDVHYGLRQQSHSTMGDRCFEWDNGCWTIERSFGSLVDVSEQSGGHRARYQ